MAKMVTFAPQHHPTHHCVLHNNDDAHLGDEQQRRSRQPNSDPVVLLAVLELDLLEESLFSSSSSFASTAGEASSNLQPQQTTFLTKLRIRASELQQEGAESPNSSHYASSSSDDSSYYRNEHDDINSISSILHFTSNNKITCSVQTLQTKIQQHLAASPHSSNDNNNYHLETAIFDPVVREHVPLDSFAAADDIVERFGTRLRIRLTEQRQPRQHASSSSLLAIQGRYFAFDGTLSVVQRRRNGSGHQEPQQATEETVTLTFAETPNQPNAGTGFNVWDGALLLAHYLQLQESMAMLENRRVLELGAGCGVAGLTAAACGARHVTLTDLPDVLPLLESNVQRNQAALRLQEATTTVSCQACDWFQPLPRELQHHSFDVILVADCVWTQDLVAPLLAVLKQLTEEPTISGRNKNNKNDDIDTSTISEDDEAVDYFAVDTHEDTAALLNTSNNLERSLEHMDLTTASPRDDDDDDDDDNHTDTSPVNSLADIYNQQQQRLLRNSRLWSSKELGDEASCGSLQEHETVIFPLPAPPLMCRQRRDERTFVPRVSDFAADLSTALRARTADRTSKDEKATTSKKKGPQVLISYQRRGKATHEAFRQGLHELFSHVEVLEPAGLNKPNNVFYLLSCHR